MPSDVAPAAATPFLKSLAIQWRVIHALMMREAVTRFGRNNIGLLWLIAEPMLFTAGVAAFWTATGLHQRSNIPIVAFAVTGYSSVLMWRSAVNRCNRAVQENFNLLYHRNVILFDVFFARVLLEAAGVTSSFVFLTLLFSSAGVISLPADPVTVAAGWLMLAWFGFALAVLVGAACAHSEIVDRFWHPISYLLFPLSGAAYMVDWLPPTMQEIVLWLPMVHGVELMREGYFGDVVRTHYDMGYMSTVNLVLTFFGLVLLRSAASQVERR